MKSYLGHDLGIFFFELRQRDELKILFSIKLPIINQLQVQTHEVKKRERVSQNLILHFEISDRERTWVKILGQGSVSLLKVEGETKGWFTAKNHRDRVYRVFIIYRNLWSLVSLARFITFTMF